MALHGHDGRGVRGNHRTHFPGSELRAAYSGWGLNALDFLEEDKGMDRAVAYAYLSAAADFAISQVVDRTVGVHGLIRKADFG